MSCPHPAPLPSIAEAGMTTVRQVCKVDRLNGILSQYDQDTERHTEKVAVYAWEIAKKMSLEKGVRQRLLKAARLHDIGKISVALSILHKPGELTDAEFSLIRRHPSIGAEIVRAAGLPELATIVAAHHERWDGRGYPAGLRGEEIPLEARIICLADSVDAMRAHRPYNRPKDEAEIRAELIACAGKQFDPRVVAAFLDVLDEQGDGFLSAWPEGLITLDVPRRKDIATPVFG